MIKKQRENNQCKYSAGLEFEKTKHTLFSNSISEIRKQVKSRHWKRAWIHIKGEISPVLYSPRCKVFTKEEVE